MSEIQINDCQNSTGENKVSHIPDVVSSFKLSEAQIKVISKMQEGWEMGYSTSSLGTRCWGTRCWIQENGVGKGGRTIRVNTSTFRKLRKLKIINGEYDFPATKYQLTNLGKNINC